MGIQCLSNDSISCSFADVYNLSGNFDEKDNDRDCRSMTFLITEGDLEVDDNERTMACGCVGTRGTPKGTGRKTKKVNDLQRNVGLFFVILSKGRFERTVLIIISCKLD